METSQIGYQKVNPILRWLMVLSLIAIFFTLLISWTFWFLWYRNIIEAMLVHFDFQTFNIIVLAVSGTALSFSWALIFSTKKSTINNFFSLLSFVFSLAIVGTSLFFYYNVQVEEFLIIGLPWLITVVSAGFLFIGSTINLIMIKNNFNFDSIEKESSLTLEEVQEEKKILLKKSSIDDIIKLQQNEAKIAQENEVQAVDLTFADLTIVREQNEAQAKKVDLKKTKQKLNKSTKWTEQQIKEVWEKAEVILGFNKDLYRKDYAGAWMFYSAFIADSEGSTFNVPSYSWTITNNKPVTHKGTNDIENLSPMNIINAVAKGQSYPQWKTKVSSHGNENIVKEQIWCY